MHQKSSPQTGQQLSPSSPTYTLTPRKAPRLTVSISKAYRVWRAPAWPHQCCLWSYLDTLLKRRSTRHTVESHSFCPYCSHFLASLPDGGLICTGAFLTSSQFVLSEVPPLSEKLFIIAFLVSSSALENRFWKNSLSVLSPLTLGSSALVFAFSESRIVLVTLSQFLRAWGRVVPAFVAVTEKRAELARAKREDLHHKENNACVRRTIRGIPYETAPAP